MSSPAESVRAFIVFGASGGIGAHVARQLNAAGQAVMLASRKSARLDDLARELQAPKWELDAAKCDQVEDCFEAASRDFGGVYGAVNCVGSLLFKPAHRTLEAEWHETIAANLTTAFAIVRGAAKTMTRTGGSIVLLSSAAARVGLPNHEAIAAAKAGVVGLAQSAAASYAARNLRFNVVAPGLVKTALTKRIWESEAAAANSMAMHPLGRCGEPGEVASLIVWLLDPANSWVTGEVFSIDGGLGNVRSHLRQSQR